MVLLDVVVEVVEVVDVMDVVEVVEEVVVMVVEEMVEEILDAGGSSAVATRVVVLDVDVMLAGGMVETPASSSSINKPDPDSKSLVAEVETEVGGVPMVGLVAETEVHF
jgi:hypothetical protein